LRDLRHAAGMSQRELAKRMGVPRTYASKVEGSKCLPTLPSFERYVRALGVTSYEVLRQCEDRGAALGAESMNELTSDPFIALLLPHVSSLPEQERRTVLARIAAMARAATTRRAA